MAFGGNTSCVGVTIGDLEIVLDSGTGVRSLGAALLGLDRRRATLLLSHTHWDHIQGFPFFGPAYRPDVDLRIMAGHLPASIGGIRAALAGQMTEPMFPVPLDIMRAKMTFDDFVGGESFDLGPGIKVKTAPLRHPNGATGYRIESGGAAFCYVTDTEHIPGQPDQNILGLIEGADLVAYDSTYTDDEFPGKLGWGHSTWQEGVRLAMAAHVKRIAIFHHDPDHDDHFLRGVATEAKTMFKGASLAREGMTVVLGK